MITLSVKERRQSGRQGPLSLSENFSRGRFGGKREGIHVIERMALETPMGKLSLYTFASPGEIRRLSFDGQFGEPPVSGRSTPGGQVS